MCSEHDLQNIALHLKVHKNINHKFKLSDAVAVSLLGVCARFGAECKRGVPEGARRVLQCRRAVRGSECREELQPAAQLLPLVARFDRSATSIVKHWRCSVGAATRRLATCT